MPERKPAIQIRGQLGWSSLIGRTANHAMAHRIMPPTANGTVGGSSGFSGGGADSLVVSGCGVGTNVRLQAGNPAVIG